MNEGEIGDALIDGSAQEIEQRPPRLLGSGPIWIRPHRIEAMPEIGSVERKDLAVRRACRVDAEPHGKPDGRFGDLDEEHRCAQERAHTTRPASGARSPIRCSGFARPTSDRRYSSESATLFPASPRESAFPVPTCRWFAE